MFVSPKDRDVLRRLGGEVAAIAALPVQQETISLWKALNGLRPKRPMVMIDQIPWHEMDVDGELALQCEDDFCRRLETGLRQALYRWKHMRGDMVVEPEVTVWKVIHNSWYGIHSAEQTAVLDAKNDVMGHYYLDQVPTEADIERIRTPEVRLNEEATAQAEEKAHAIFDGILKVRMQGMLPTFAAWDLITQWHGVENTLADLGERPEFMHRLVGRLVDAAMGMLDQAEAKGLLGCRQSWIHCTGAFADELPAAGFDAQRPRAKDLWTFGMAQIFGSVSPAMHQEFEVNYMKRWYARWGLVYYGCCEPLDDRLDVIRQLPNVRKISMSPWVNLRRGAEGIGKDYVFSRKPSPALLATDAWNPNAVEADLRETVRTCNEYGCPLELILKDISTVRYEPQRLWEWARIARDVVGG
jgi:hypothetical protein